MFFAAENYSWSESHYFLGGNDFVSAVLPAQTLVQNRKPLLGDYANLTACRLSYVPANRQIYDLNRGAILTAGASFAMIPGGNSSDQPFTSLMVNLQNQVANKNLYLAGIPDGVIQVNPNFPSGYEPGGDFDTQLSYYLGYLCGNNGGAGTWGFRSRLRNASIMINGLESQPGYNNNIGVSTAVNPGVPAGSEAYITGFKRINPRVPSLAGAYTVVAVIPPGSGSANFVTVLQETGNVDPDNFLALGVISPLIFQYLPYQNYRVVRATHRKRGGSYGLPRGRSRARR